MSAHERRVCSKSLKMFEQSTQKKPKCPQNDTRNWSVLKITPAALHDKRSHMNFSKVKSLYALGTLKKKKKKGMIHFKQRGGSDLLTKVMIGATLIN